MGSYEDLMQDGKEFASLIKTHVKDSKAKDNAEEEEADEEEEATGKDKKYHTPPPHSSTNGMTTLMAMMRMT
jgi:hypothetical protein